MPADTAAAATKPSLSIRRRIKAPPERLYAAWTQPEQLIRWFVHDGATMLKTEFDVRVGGRFDLQFKSPDGEMHGVAGTYREVDANRKLVFTWAWRSTPDRESLVTVALKPDGDATVLTLTHEQFFDQKARDAHEGGWTRLLTKLENLFS